MPAAYDRCLKHVAGKVRNPHAVCTAVNAGHVKEYRRKKAARRKHHMKTARNLGIVK